MSMSSSATMSGGDTASIEPFLEEGNRPHVLLPPEVEETEKQVPTCASSWAKFKSWFWKFQYPLKIIFLNFISWVLVQSLLMNSGGFGYYPRHIPGSGNFQFKTMLCAAFTISLLTFVVDANLCLTAARNMEQTVQKWRQEEGESGSVGSTTDTSTTTEEPKAEEEKEDPYIYVKLSRKVDSAFGCPSGSMTFLVAFLYSLFAITAWQASLSGAGLLQVQLTPTEDLGLGEKGRCFLGSASSFFEDYSMYESGEERDGIASLRTAPGFDALPAEVQKWIQGHSNRDSDGMIYLGRRLANVRKFNQSRPYLQLSDGSWVFAKANSAGNPFYHRSSTLTRDKKPGFAVISPETNTVKEYSTAAAEEAGDDELFDGMRYIEGIELVGFPAQPPYSAWCGIFKLHKRGLFQDEVLCYNVNSAKLQRFLPVMQDGRHWCYWSGDQYSLFAIPDDYTLWMATKRTWSKCNHHNGNREKRNMALTLLAYNTETMEKTVPLMLNTTKDRQDGGGGKRTLRPVCRGTYWISFGASILSLGLLSAFLYRSEGVPSCTVPAALAVSHLISVLLKPAAAGVAILAGAGACLFLLLAVRRASTVWKYVSTEMLVWALYTLQLASNAVFWWPSFSDYTFYDHEVLFSFLLPFPLLSFLMAAVTTVLLDHPVFQLMAVCFGCLSLFTVLMVVAGLNLLMVPVGLCALALGCFRAGTLLQTYRVHVLVYARRLYLQCCAKSRWLQRRTAHGS